MAGRVGVEVAVAVAKAKKSESASGWSPRLAGVLLCAFFVLGAMTGFSEAGRRVVLRAKNLVTTWTDRTLAKLGPFRHAADTFDQSIVPLETLLRLRSPAQVPSEPVDAKIALPRTSDDAVAIVERRDGFYALLARGEIRGPVSPAQQPNLPIMSGAGVETAKAPDLLAYAEILVRAEAQMSSLISEMRIDSDGAASFYLDRQRMAVVVDLDQESFELARALDILAQWRGRERLIAMLDMTTPNMAVVRLKTDLPKQGKRAPVIVRSTSSEPARVSIVERRAVVR